MEKRKNLFTGRVLRDIKGLRDSPHRLGNALKFDHSLKLPKGYNLNKLINVLDLGTYKTEQRLEDLRILLANLLNANGGPISVSFNRNHWKESQYRKASYFTLVLIKQMEDTGLIEIKPGYRGKKNSRKTRIWTLDQLTQFCPELKQPVISEPVTLVELRDWNGKRLAYKDTAWTTKVKGMLSAVNTVNNAAEIRRGREVYRCNFVAIYKQKFTLYGRLHTRGFHHVQGLDEDERAELTINGDPVVELDFSALHPNLLYANQGIQYPLDQDPYMVINPLPPVRPYLKQLLLYLLNSKDFTQAEAAGNNWLFEHKRERRQLRGLGIKRARPLLEHFMKAHAPISKYFCNGKESGLRCMNLDAKICLDIVHDFAKTGIPIISIHDSFIVQQQFRDQLRTAMEDRYRQHTNGFKIRIK